MRIGQYDKDHHELSDGLDPSPERHVAIVGPEGTHTAVEKKEQDRTIRSKERSDFMTSSDKHNQACHGQTQEHSSIERTSFEVGAARTWGCHLQPERYRPRALNEEP